MKSRTDSSAAPSTSAWPVELVDILKRFLPTPIVEVVLRRAANQSKLGPQDWATSVQRRRLVDGLCQRAAVFLKRDQADAFREALLEPSAIRDEELPSLLVLEVRDSDGLFAARQNTIDLTQKWAANRMMRTRAATIVSELARNVIDYAGGGTVTLMVTNRRLKIVVKDSGSGIPRLEEILAGTYRSRKGGGLGLVGSRRLADDFNVVSSSELGTVVTAELQLD